LMEEHGLTQEELSNRVGKSRPFIANTVRLLALPDKVKNLVVQGIITAGHARAILAIAKSKQEEVATKIASKGWSVRQTENVVKEILSGKERAKKVKEKQDPLMSEIEERLRMKLSTKVSIKKGRKRGLIEIEYYGDEELQRLLEAIIGEFEL